MHCQGSELDFLGKQFKLGLQRIFGTRTDFPGI